MLQGILFPDKNRSLHSYTTDVVANVCDMPFIITSLHELYQDSDLRNNTSHMHVVLKRHIIYNVFWDHLFEFCFNPVLCNNNALRLLQSNNN